MKFCRTKLVPFLVLFSSVLSGNATCLGQRVKVTGVLVPAPNSGSAELPHLSVDGNPVSAALIKLVLPGDASTRKIIARHMDQQATVWGVQSELLRTGKGPDSIRQVVHVERLEVAVDVTHNLIGQKLNVPQKNILTIIGKYSTRDGRWISITSNNGLWLADRDNQKTHGIYGSVDQGGSAIDWTSSAVIAPDENTIFVRQGLGGRYLRLSDLTRITWRDNPTLQVPHSGDDQQMVLWFFEGFSPDSKYVVERKWIAKSRKNDLRVFSIATGQMVAYHRSMDEKKSSQFAFLSDRRTFVVSEGDRFSTYDLSGGNPKRPNANR